MLIRGLLIGSLQLAGVLQGPNFAAPAVLDSGFRPRLIELVLTHAEVRPGDSFSYQLLFVNEGTAPADRDYLFFMHFEEESGPLCSEISFGRNRKILERPTGTWLPGELIVDGPRIFPVPDQAQEGEYRIHLGLFDPSIEDGRILDEVAGTLSVTHSATPSSEWQPRALSLPELAKRREALAGRLEQPLVLQTEAWTFALDRTGAFLLTDRSSGVVWSSNPNKDRWGVVRLKSANATIDVPIESFDELRRKRGRLLASTSIRWNGQPTGCDLALEFSPTKNGLGLRVRCETESRGDWTVTAVRALDKAFSTTDADGGATFLPRYLGLRQTADRGLPATRAFQTYDTISMAMCGLSKQNSALLVAWNHAGATLWTHVTLEDSPLVAGRRTHSLSLSLSHGASEFEIFPLGYGDYEEVARAYRRWVGQRGLRLTRLERARERPLLGELSGAAIFRPCVLDRFVPNTTFNASSSERVLVNYTFSEVARAAKHWRQDLGIDRALIVLAGWNRRGYDNELPDTLPANSECGGDAGLADCVRTVQEQGFLMGLHDNYIDLFEDAPSWDPFLVVKDARGDLRKQRVWSGGLSYMVCSKMQSSLALRNWPIMRSRYGADLIYLDTTLVDYLKACADPAHPTTRMTDLEAKKDLLTLSRDYFPIAASEGGSEWAIPHADQFGGLLTQKTMGGVGTTVIPLLPMVYSDCVRIGTMQGDRVGIADAGKVLAHLLYAEMPIYDIGKGLYFDGEPVRGLPVRVEVVACEQISRERFRMTYRWRANGPIEEDYAAFVHFTHRWSLRPERVSFQDDHAFPLPTSMWKPGQVIEVGPRDVDIREDLEGEWEVWIGLTNGEDRILLEDLPSRKGRHRLGSIYRHGERLWFEPAQRDTDRLCFARGDGGWAANLGQTDRMIKNTWEVLSWVDRITADRPMTGHRYLTDDGSVESTSFQGVTITVNQGETPYEVDGTILPRNGFLVSGATFEAFYATRHRGIDYEDGALFTLRSMDGRALKDSSRVRIFHGFGSPAVVLRDKIYEVRREAEILK